MRKRRHAERAGDFLELKPMHRIRLRGPWNYRTLSGDAALPPSGTVTMPASWRGLFGNRAGEVCFSRHFNTPTNLTDQDRVALVFDGIGGTATVWLNGELLGEVAVDAGRAIFDVSGRLTVHNCLEVSIRFDPRHGTESAGGLFDVVALEIDAHDDPAPPHNTEPRP